jgi:hypothetical protein
MGFRIAGIKWGKNEEGGMKNEQVQKANTGRQRAAVRGRMAKTGEKSHPLPQTIATLCKPLQPFAERTG